MAARRGQGGSPPSGAGARGRSGGGRERIEADRFLKQPQYLTATSAAVVSAPPVSTAAHARPHTRPPRRPFDCVSSLPPGLSRTHTGRRVGAPQPRARLRGRVVRAIPADTPPISEHRSRALHPLPPVYLLLPGSLSAAALSLPGAHVCAESAALGNRDMPQRSLPAAALPRARAFPQCQLFTARGGRVLDIVKSRRRIEIPPVFADVGGGAASIF